MIIDGVEMPCMRPKDKEGSLAFGVGSRSLAT